MRLAIEAAQKLKVFRPTFSKGSMIHTNVSDTERFYSCPPHFVFALESELTLPTIAASITAKDPDLNERPYGSIDAVFVLGKGWAINFGDGTGGYKYADANGISRPGWQWAATDAVLFHCLAWLSAVMPVVLRFEPIILGYMVPQKP
jgi:hypothetical protein